MQSARLRAGAAGLWLLTVLHVLLLWMLLLLQHAAGGLADWASRHQIIVWQALLVR
jgi:hypothetical protein